MNLSKLIIIFLSFLKILCLREKLRIVNTSNQYFQNEENSELIFVFKHMKDGANSPCYGLNDYYTDIFEQQWKGYWVRWPGNGRCKTKIPEFTGKSDI